jgi:hypothetical protein
MKRLWLLCINMVCCLAIQAQNNHYAAMGTINIPAAQSYSTKDIAGYINQHFSTATDKLLAAYNWVTNNIEYNTDSMFYRYWGEDPERKLQSVLKTRKGVCENFAALLASIAMQCGIPAYTVNGYTKINGSVKWQGHSWCAVYLGNEWLLCDPTWDWGNKGSNRFFLIPPEDFIQTHMPFDPLWQLLEQPLTHKEFRQAYHRNKKGSNIYNYRDSVQAYLASDTLQQMEAFSRRMKQAGIDNDELRTWYAYNEMKIFIVYQEKDMQVFNSAVKDLNAAKSLFNTFVQYRNNKMLSAKSDTVLSRNFEWIDSLLQSARLKADEIGRYRENYQYDTEGLLQNITTLEEKARQQKIFLRKYFTASLTERDKLLYR